MVSREIGEDNARIGFEVIDLAANKCGWLAHVNRGLIRKWVGIILILAWKPQKLKRLIKQLKRAM